jgi:hypothetical protein
MASARAIATRCCWPPDNSSGETDAVEHFSRDRFGVLFRRLLHHHLRQHDIAAGGEMREQVELLKNHADLQAQRLEMHLIGQELGTGDDDRAFIDGLQPVDAAQQRRLARTALADDGDDLARRDVDGNPLQHLVVAEALLHLSDCDERH